MEYSSTVLSLAEFFGSTPKYVSDFLDMLSAMLSGSITTLSIFFLTLLFAIPLAVFIALGKKSKIKVIAFLCNIFMLIIRGTPLMLQLLIVYFVPKLVAIKFTGRPIDWSSYLAAVVAFSINYACYFAEIYRGGFESIPKGQYEAAKVLGYTRGQTFFNIVLPQVVKRIIPAMGNEVITLVKDTSLVTILSVQELMFYANSNATRMVSFIPLLIAGIFYFVMNYVVAFTFKRIEAGLSYYK